MLNIVQNIVPKNKWDIKCPYAMDPKYIAVHNTANDASARNEIQYMISNNNEVSFHYAVDDVEAVQGIREDRNAWHASDGAYGEGNRKAIAIEICYSKSGGERFDKAEENTALLIVQLMKKYNIPLQNVKRHYDFASNHKHCPHRTMDKGWDRFLSMVKAACDGEEVVDVPSNNAPQTSEKYSVGIPVCVKQLCTSSTGGKIANGHWTNGVIGSIVHGAPYPYRIDRDGTPIGWVNDAIIGADPHIPGSAPVNDPVTPQPSGRWTDQVFEVGSYAKLRGIFRVDQVLADRDSIWCEELTGDGGNSIQAGPLTKCDADGNRTANQVFKVGDYFYCDEKFKVLGVDAKTDAIKINVGGRVIWVYAGPCDEVL